MENELNAISKMKPEYADRAFSLLEKSLEYRNSSDKEIIELERKELEIREEDNNKYYFWNGFGMILAAIISLVALLGGIILTIKGCSTGAIISFLIAALNLAPKFIKSFEKTKK